MYMFWSSLSTIDRAIRNVVRARFELSSKVKELSNDRYITYVPHAWGHGVYAKAVAMDLLE